MRFSGSDNEAVFSYAETSDQKRRWVRDYWEF